MKHKYLEDIGIKLENTPYGWNPNDERQEDWKEERQVYGFDERETWSLDTTFFYWLYERLMKYNETGGRFIDTSYHKFNLNGKEMTQQQCMDRMTELCKKYFKLDEAKDFKEENKILDEVEEIFDILKACIWSLNW